MKQRGPETPQDRRCLVKAMLSGMSMLRLSFERLTVRELPDQVLSAHTVKPRKATGALNN